MNLMASNESKRVALTILSELEFSLTTSSKRRFLHAKIETRKFFPLWRAITREGKGPVVRDDAKSIKLRWDFHPGASFSRQKSDFLR